VLALRHGSVPEVIRHGVTGYIGDSEDELVEAVRRIGVIHRAACRADAERRFSSGAMASEYERLYHRLVQGGDGTTPQLTAS
jgi:glycosyltransferase involved in cell wall biosynthesis